MNKSTKKGRPFLLELSHHNQFKKRGLPYESVYNRNRLGSSKKQDISKVFHTHLEKAINTLLVTELTAFLDYEKYDRSGFNLGNSRNGSYSRTLHME